MLLVEPDLLSESAVAIANLDSPQNPVCRRLREALRKAPVVCDVLDLNRLYGPRFWAVQTSDNERLILVVRDAQGGDCDWLWGIDGRKALRWAVEWIEERRVGS